MSTAEENQLKAFVRKFKILEILGQGSYGVVVKAEHHKGNCAIKLCSKDRLSLQREFEIYDHIKSSVQTSSYTPNIYGYGNLTDFSWLAMDLLGPSIDDLYQKLGSFSKTTILQMGIQMLNCVDFLHRCGVVHGDIKGDNFAISATNSKKIVIFDFGLASKIDDWTESFRGSLLYASIATHQYQPVQPKDDIESIGYLLAGFHKSLPWSDVKWPDTYEEQIDFGLLLKKEKDIFKMSEDFFELTLYLMHVDAQTKPSSQFLKEIFRFVDLTIKLIKCSNSFFMLYFFQ